MMAGAIALYEEALHQQAPLLVMRTADGRMPPTRNCSSALTGQFSTWAAALAG